MKNLFEKVEISYVSYKGEELPIAVAELAPMHLMSAAASSIADAVFDGNEYTPEWFDVALWTVVARVYSDLDVTALTDEDAVAEVYNRNDNSLVLTLSNIINKEQLDMIQEAADRRIQKRAIESQFDLLCKDVRAMLAKYDTVLEKAVTDKNIKRLLKKAGDFFTKGDLETILKNINKGGAVM